MTHQDAKRGDIVSPRAEARLAGVLYLIVFIAIYAARTRDLVFISGDPAATAQAIAAHTTELRFALGADLIAAASYLAVTALLYRLFKPAGSALALMSLVFGIAGCTIMALNLIWHGAPFVLLNDAVTESLGQGQAEALAYASLRLHAMGYNIAIVFFATQLALWGALALKSRFLPWVLGVLLLIAGPVNLTRSFAALIGVKLWDELYPYILLPGLVAEAALALWLAAFSVSAERWRAQAQETR